MKTTFEIEDFFTSKTIRLMEDGPVYESETGRKALDMYLKQIGFNGKVKVSASSSVHFKVQPIVIDENGRKWLDGRKRALWYQILG